MNAGPTPVPDRAHALFISALRLDRDRREAFLRERCDGNETLYDEVASLLSHHEAGEDFLDPGSRPFANAAAEWSPLPVGAQIGHYTIRGVLGAGGMGMVYLAEQDSPRRTVALKLIRPGVASASLLRRFEHEAQVLGLLQHPGIAQVYEAGTAEAGAGPQPYFAMELVRGRPLSEAARSMGLRERLELFAAICDAVQHAHAKGVIHRDLKPANILVDDSAQPQPKILDFGVARVAGGGAQMSSLHTLRGQLIGTLAYMSPEQVAGEEADTRSDVYALGVILYELLCGHVPHEAGQRGVPEVIRAIREDDPAPLSSIDRLLAGDVETIAVKALEKYAARRYQSASELAEDVRRYLRDEPILARRPTLTYRVRKFARRNRALVAAAGAGTLALIAGLVGTSLALVRAVGAERESRAQTAVATRSAERAKAINSVLMRMLAGIDPEEARSLDRTLLSKLLAAAAREADEEPDPEVQGAVRAAIGRAYERAGLYDLAEQQLSRALPLLESSLGEHDRVTLDAMDELARVRQATERAEAEALYRREAALRTAAFGERDPDTIAAVNNLAVLYCDELRYEDARPLAERSLALRREVLGDSHRETLESLAAMASVHLGTGHSDLAEPIYRQIYDARVEMLGEDHPSTLTALGNLAFLLDQNGKEEEALPLMEKSLTLDERVLGADHPFTLGAVNNLASLCRRLKQYDRAEQLYRRLLSSGAQPFGAESERYLAAMHNFGALLFDQRQYVEAESLGARAVAGARQHMGASWYTAAFMTQHAMELTALERYADAEAELTEASGIMDRATNVSPQLKAKHAKAFATLYTKWGKPDEAAKWAGAEAK